MPYDFDLPHAAGVLANGAGVQPWSSPEQYVIFSIDLPLANAGRVPEFEQWALDWDIGFKRLVGCYKGEQEPAWCINARDWRALAASGWIDGQESVLHLGPWQSGGRPATLWFRWADEPTGPESYGVKQIGTFRLTTEKRAKASDAWTFDPTTAEYYIAD